MGKEGKRNIRERELASKGEAYLPEKNPPTHSRGGGGNKLEGGKTVHRPLSKSLGGEFF